MNTLYAVARTVRLGALGALNNRGAVGNWAPIDLKTKATLGRPRLFGPGSSHGVPSRWR
jgi:hypothetical protein